MKLIYNPINIRLVESERDFHLNYIWAAWHSEAGNLTGIMSDYWSLLINNEHEELDPYNIYSEEGTPRRLSSL